jgi:hypothetical protein
MRTLVLRHDAKANQEFGYGGNMYNLSGVSDLSKAVKIYKVDVTGYAYNMRDATILSCMVLLSCTTELIALYDTFDLYDIPIYKIWF